MTNSPSLDQENIHPAAMAEEELLRRCKVRRQRRSGPGGQHRNKVETAIVIVHEPTGLRCEASERRSQEENRTRALFRLRVNLALQVRSAVQIPPKPSDLWNSRNVAGKIAVNSSHQHFPALLAEALDAVLAAEMDAKQASQWLGCSPSQLVKFLQRESRAMEWINRERRAKGQTIYR